MIRQSLCWLYVFVFAAYAWRDWYKSLCGLIILTAVIEHPDLPKSLFGVQGLNPWNALLAIVIASWLVSRRREALKWDMPSYVSFLLICYIIVVIIGFFRMLADYQGVVEGALAEEFMPPSKGDLWSENFINCLKWIVPGLLLFDGCHNRKRLVLGALSILAVYFILAAQVISWMPLSSISSGTELSERALKILQNEVGYSRVNMSMILAGGAWALFCARPLFESRKLIFILLLASVATFFGQALTGGRTGYGTWMVIGLVLCSLRWRRYLLVLPLVVLLVIGLVPSAMERVTQGFTPDTVDQHSAIPRQDATQDGPDLYTITAGRNIAWPYVMEKIGENPIVGYGRLAMARTGIAGYLWQEFSESFPHPHNAYLEALLDNGVIGATPILIFYILITGHSISLFKDSRNPIFVSIGGITLSLLLALLVAAFGSQTFYPREGSAGMWASIGLMLRVYVQRRSALGGSKQDLSLAIDDTMLWSGVSSKT